MRIRNEFCISLSEQKRKFKGAGDALIISFLHGEEVVGELKEGERMFFRDRLYHPSAKRSLDHLNLAHEYLFRRASFFFIFFCIGRWTWSKIHTWRFFFFLSVIIILLLKKQNTISSKLILNILQ